MVSNKRLGSARYNPLLAIPRAAEQEVAAAQDVADILVNPQGREAAGGERFFEEQARTLLTGVMLHLLYTKPRPSRPASRCRQRSRPTQWSRRGPPTMTDRLLGQGGRS
jgi:type IV secretory pathway TraG/TraD family ATPase VirD4